MLALAIAPHLQQYLQPDVLARMTASSKMVSKRSARTYKDEDGHHDEIITEWRRSARLEETPLVAMDRRSSTASSTRASSEASSSTWPSERAAGPDQDDELMDAAGWSDALAASARPSYRPTNFGVVVPGVYRSSYPQAENYPFIRSLGLKTIITLVDRDSPEGYMPFMTANGIKHHVFDMKGTKKEAIPVRVMKSILRLVLDRQNHPLLIHCNHGKHRTGCVVAVVRKIAGWDVQSILDEYRAYAAPKVRECDIEYITNFQVSNVSNLFSETKAVSFQIPNFYRVFCFTIIILAIWTISGTRLATSSTSSRRNRAERQATARPL